MGMQFLCHYGFMNSPKIYASLIHQYGIDVCSEKEKYRDFFQFFNIKIGTFSLNIHKKSGLFYYLFLEREFP